VKKYKAFFATIIFPVFVLAGPDLTSGSDSGKTLDIYFIDVEGGAATLIVTPQRESLLMDCGWKRDDARDAKRIHQVATQAAGLSQIDYFVASHFHMDHYGSIGELSKLIPIKRFYDHAVMTDLAEDKDFQSLYADYQKASAGKRQTLRAGDVIPLQQGRTPLKLVCIVSNGEVISKPAGVGAGPNPNCKGMKLMEEDSSDNAKSIGILLSFGKFEFLDNGDLTWNIEHKLVCPENRIGVVDLYMVTHHGMNISNNPALVRAIQPKVSVMCNGPRKGGDPGTVALLRSLPSLQAAYQLHRSVETSEKENTDRAYIANWEEACKGAFIKASVTPDGQSYTVTVGNNGMPQKYLAQ
jgi:competence protein ComEC